MAKKILIAVVVLVLVIAGAAYLLYSNLGSLLKVAIETYGAEATQSKVTVASVSLSAWSGQGMISGLVVDNPKGFTTPHAIEVGSIAIAVDTGTLTHNPVEVTEVTISSPHVTYEQGASGGNLQALQQNVSQYAHGSAAAPATPAASTPAPAPASTPAQPKTPVAGGTQPAASAAPPPERKLIIDKLDVTGGDVTVAAALLQGRALTTSLPPIHLTDIGKQQGGATPAQVAQLVVAAITEQAAKAATAELQKSLGNVGGAAAQQKLEQLQKSAPGGVGNQLKGLFGK